MSEPVGAGPGSDRAWREAASILVLGVLAWVLPGFAARVARPAVLNLGPNDRDYVTGFRSDWERDGATRFHWTTRSASITLPIAVRGENFKLYLRVRRHFIEPAHVNLVVEGRAVATFDIQADPRVAYRTVEVPLPRLEGDAPFTLAIEAPSENPRPLGIALDWIQIGRGPGAPFRLLARMRLALLLTALLAFLAPRLAGAPRPLALAHALALTLGASLGTFWDVIAAERIVREGLPIYAFLSLLAVILTGWPRTRDALAIPPGACAGGLVVVVLTALAIRLTLLLHPQFYYPDMRVHGLFALQLAKDGIVTFLREFTVNQYRHSLGLQMVGAHWYAFPYPPAFYILCWPLLRLAHYAPDVAVSVLAAGINSLEAFLVFAIARRLRGSSGLALAAAAALPLLPIFLARLTLAYFPAITGHAVDTVVLLYLLSRLDRLDRPRVVVALGGLLALALLTYTQSVLNFGILLPLFLALEVAADRTPAAWRRHAGLALSGALGLCVATAVFYGRYVPIALDMKRGVPMPEERVLLEKLEQRRAVPSDDVNEDRDDPFAGPDLDLVRGLKKAAWRLFIFYDVFAPLVVLAALLLVRAAPGAQARLLSAWLLTYVLLNLASGGLPGPNLVRYNKDVEIVAPLCCVGLATIGSWLWSWGRAGRLFATAYGASFAALGVSRAARYLTEKFVLER